MRNRLRLPALALLLFLAQALGLAQSPESLLPSAGGLLWSREESAAGLTQVMKEEETRLSQDRTTWLLGDSITVDKASPLSAFFSGFTVAYREDLLRGRIDEAGFSVAAGSLVGSLRLEPRLDLVLPWGTESLKAEYERASGGPYDTIVIRYNLFKLRYALSGLDRLVATKSLDEIDKLRVTLKLYTDRGTFSLDLPLPWFLELYRRLKLNF